MEDIEQEARNFITKDRDWNNYQGGDEIVYMLTQFHKQQVEAITDEEMEKEFPKYQDTLTIGKRNGAKWFKDKLLKEISNERQ